jgi:hypothetical protein
MPMRRLISIAAAAVLTGSATLSDTAAAAPVPFVDLNALGSGAKALPLEEAQYFWGGQNYCWYPGGWRGPGWYWCGYGARQGYGWGGGYGWRGWGVPGGYVYGYRPGWNGGYRPRFYGGGAYRGGVYRGGGYGYRGGIYRGGGFQGRR